MSACQWKDVVFARGLSSLSRTYSQKRHGGLKVPHMDTKSAWLARLSRGTFLSPTDTSLAADEGVHSRPAQGETSGHALRMTEFSASGMMED
jgi:hypothetical protein